MAGKRIFVFLLVFIGFFAARAHEPQLVDVAVVGGGCAGLSAAFTVAYLNHSVIAFMGDLPGGQLMGSNKVENIPGIIPQSGAEFIEALEQQARTAGARLEYAVVDNIYEQKEGLKKFFVITTSQGAVWHARAIVLAMGGKPRILNIRGEAELLNKYIFTCAICDGKQTEQKEVYVVGGGDASIDALITLHDFGPKKCTLFVRSNRMRAAPRVQERLKETGIGIEYNTRILEVRPLPDGVELTIDTPRGVEKRLSDFVFYAIGHIPNTSEPWVQQLVVCDTQGYITVSARQETSRKGVFAAGDIATPFFHQASYAIGCGQLAAKSAVDYITQ